MANEGETCDELRRYGLTICQPQKGYRFSLDALLLADFAGSGRENVASLIDLGSGSGVVALILARVYTAADVWGVEKNPDMAALATENVMRNRLAERVRIIAADVLQHKTVSPVSCFDLVVSNPPFRTSREGRLSTVAGRDVARHESSAGLADFLAAAKYLVKPGGSICFVYHPSRLGELMHVAHTLKLAPVRLRLVHDTCAAPATMFLVELAKASRAGLTVERPLMVRQDDGRYSPEVAAILGI